MDRHLLPSEIDLLLDGEVGFGTAPLKAHIRRCGQCRGELDDARAVVRVLEHLPHLSPSPLFGDRVLSQVQIFVPWYVSALDAGRRWLPQTARGRVVFGVAGGAVAAALTLVSLWLVSQLDMLLFATGLLLDRVREAALGAAGSVLGGTLGEPGYALVRTGGLLGLALVTLVLFALALGAARLIRAVTIPRKH